MKKSPKARKKTGDVRANGENLRTMTAAVIIPAKDEEPRIAAVLEAVLDARLPREIIVVNDGSTDGTAGVVRRFPRVTLVDLPKNVGKGGAMMAGVKSTEAAVIAFVDADLSGLKAEHVDSILQPILNGTCDMCIGVFRGGKFWSDTAQRISPYISGQRAMRRRLFESTPFISDSRLGVEVALNTHAKRQRARIHRVLLHGVSNTFKENKMGIMKGAAARAKMYTEIGKAMAKMRKARRGR